MDGRSGDPTISWVGEIGSYASSLLWYTAREGGVVGVIRQEQRSRASVTPSGSYGSSTMVG
jgi:hypothetical protein